MNTKGKPKLERIKNLTLSEAKKLLAKRENQGAWLEYNQKKGKYTLIREVSNEASDYQKEIH